MIYRKIPHRGSAEACAELLFSGSNDELVEGEALDKRLNDGEKIPLKEAVRIARAICEALEYAHGKKIIHRDIKPANVMLGKDGAVKVMDFGIAREAHDTLSRLTHVETSGTLAYMAPEQHLGLFNESTDLYALGATLYEMLAGETPFRGPDFLAQKREMIFKPLREAVPDVPKSVEEIVARCLQADKEKRYSSAGELKKALADV
jgi:serine/threonine-protein kinase